MSKKYQYIAEDQKLTNQVQLRNFIKFKKNHTQGEEEVLKLIEQKFDLTSYLTHSLLNGRFLHGMLERSDIRLDIFKKGLENYISQGGSLEVENREGSTPLHIACERGKIEEVKLLIAKGVKEKNVAEMLELSDKKIKKFIDLKEKYLKESKTLPAESDSLIEYISPTEAKIKIMESFIEREYSLKFKISTSQSTLHLAVKSGNLKLVELLIDKGYDLERKDEKGETALFTAFNQLDVKIVTSLLAKGANVAAKDNYDNTLMHQACASNSLKEVQLLIKHGGLLYERNKAGKLPLDVCFSDSMKIEIRKIYDNIAYAYESVANELSKDFLSAINILERFLLENKSITKEQFIKNVLNNFAKNKHEFIKQDYFLISTLIEFIGDKIVDINRKFDNPLTVKVLECHNNFIKTENIKEIITSGEISLEMILTVFCTLPGQGKSNYNQIKESIHKLINDEKYNLINQNFSKITESTIHGNFFYLNAALESLAFIFDNFKGANKQVKAEQIEEDIKQQQIKFHFTTSNPYQHIKKINNFWKESGDEFIELLQQDNHWGLKVGRILNNINSWKEKLDQNNGFLSSSLEKLEILDKEILLIEIIEEKSELNLSGDVTEENKDN